MVVPNIGHGSLLTDRFVGDKEKANDLIDFFSWDGVGKLDLQTTPIIKINEDQYYLMPAVFSVSNLIECKNSILPTSPFELRTIYNYINKAQKQLDLSSEALHDDDFRESLLKNWGVPYTDYEIHTLILLGNRIFTSPNGFKHSIRYIHELHMLFTEGIINSSFGKWRYWKNEEFSEDDFFRYISDDDPMLNDFLDAMVPYRILITCGDHRIEKESYSFNILKHFELDDRNLVALNTDEHLKMREEFQKKHEETLEVAKKIISKRMALRT